MTTFHNRPKTALLVLDMQNDVVEGAYQRDTVVANIAGLVGRARQLEVPVIWFQYSDDQVITGSPGWALVPELIPGAGEELVHKSYADPFEETSLESTLAELAVGCLVVVGAQSDECIRATLHGAVVRGYDTILVGDAHTTQDLTQWGAPPPETVVSFTNLYWSNHRAPGRTAGTIDTVDVTFGVTP